MPRLVAERYEITGEVARGGYGTVYEARDRRRGHLVAIKILHAGGSDRAAAARFIRETRVAAAIHHPNVCAVTDSGTLEDGSLFLVMERLYGETLRSYVARVGRVDPDEAIELAVQMLSGLEASHALGIVHRDMKPDNVFILRPSGSLPLVKLLDFGMCRRQSGESIDERTLTRVGSVVGTPEYMAPEQASGRRDFDLRIDLYAVGVMLFEMLTGARAFVGSDARAVLVSVLTRKLPPLRSLRPDVPAELERIVARAADRDPRKRYADAASIQHDLLHARTALRWARGSRARPKARAQGAADESLWEMPTVHFSGSASRRRD